MIKTLSFNAEILPDREVRIKFPADVPLGPAEIKIVITSRAERERSTLGDLLHSDFFGMWKDRDDIDDSVEFSRRLRRDAWSRAE